MGKSRKKNEKKKEESMVKDGYSKFKKPYKREKIKRDILLDKEGNKD